MTTRQFYPCIGGVETYMLECAKRLVRKGHEVEVLALNRNYYTNEKLKPLEEYEGIKIRRIPFIKLPLRPFPIYSPFSLLKIFINFDVIHCHDIRFLFEYNLIAKFILRKRLVITSHGFIHHQKSMLPLKRFVFKFYYSILMRYADTLHLVSKQDEDKINSNHYNIARVPGGIDYNFFSSVKQSPEPKTLLIFGRLDNHKGIENVFRILKSFPEYRLRLVYGSSEKNYFHKLKTIESNLHLGNQISWIGNISRNDLLNEIGKAEYILLPSNYEGFGLTALEAMASGSIVIANKIAAYQNIITDGINGFLFDFNNPDINHLKKIFNLIKQQKNEVSELAKKTSSAYDWDSHVEQFEKIYN